MSRNVAAAVCRDGFDPFFSPLSPSLSLSQPFFVPYRVKYFCAGSIVIECFSVLSLSLNFQMSDRSAACLQTYVDVGGHTGTAHLIFYHQLVLDLD